MNRSSSQGVNRSSCQGVNRSSSQRVNRCSSQGVTRIRGSEQESGCEQDSGSEALVYQWSVRNSDILQNHICNIIKICLHGPLKKIKEDMSAYLHQLQLEGPDLGEDMPTKPKGNILTLLGKGKQSTKLSGMELHEYLQSHMDNLENNFSRRILSIEKTKFNFLTCAIDYMDIF